MQNEGEIAGIIEVLATCSGYVSLKYTWGDSGVILPITVTAAILEVHIGLVFYSGTTS